MATAFRDGDFKAGIKKKLLEDSFVPPSRLVGVTGDVAATPVDIYQATSEMVVKVILSGKKTEGVDIIITSDNLSIKGQTKVEKK